MPGRDERWRRSGAPPMMSRGDVSARPPIPPSGPPPRRRAPRTGVLRDLSNQYGWRLYAVPLLALVTVLALATMDTGERRAPDAPAKQNAAAPVEPPVASGSSAVKVDRPGEGAHNTALAAADLPPGEPYTERGAATYQVLPGTTQPVGAGRNYRYSVEIENGIQGIDTTAYATAVDSTLADPRSWAGHGDIRVQRVDSGLIDFHVTLVSPMTVRDLCGYDIAVETSCYIPASAASPVNRVVLNLARWVRGDAAYLGDLAAYRTYMVNHEVGHAVGHQHAHACLPAGLAPIMMQQTIGLRSAKTGQMCQANPWPYPPGVEGVPGAEEPDTPQNSEFVLNGD